MDPLWKDTVCGSNPALALQLSDNATFLTRREAFIEYCGLVVSMGCFLVASSEFTQLHEIPHIGFLPKLVLGPSVRDALG